MEAGEEIRLEALEEGDMGEFVVYGYCRSSVWRLSKSRSQKPCTGTPITDLLSLVFGSIFIQAGRSTELSMRYEVI